jgi:hypothetical protein
MTRYYLHTTDGKSLRVWDASQVRIVPGGRGDLHVPDWISTEDGNLVNKAHVVMLSPADEDE